MLKILGPVIGIACYYVIGWVLFHTSLGLTLVGAGLFVWLIGGMIGGAFLVLGWLAWIFSRETRLP